MIAGLGLKSNRDLLFWRVVFVLIVLFLCVFLLVPLFSIFAKIFEPQENGRAGLFLLWDTIRQEHFLYLTKNSMAVGVTTTVFVIPLAYAFAFGLQRALVPFASVFKGVGLLPLLAPSLLPGIALIYLGGNQGILGWWIEDFRLYGFWGIVLGEVFYTFPHALLILSTSLKVGDAQLYEASLTLGANTWKRFSTITLPSTRYALFSAICIVFTLTVTDFGVAKVIGGDYPVLALEVYQSVLGQQNFPKGAAVGLILLLPSILTFMVDQHLRKKQTMTFSGKTKAYAPKSHPMRDSVFTLILLLISGLLLTMIGVAVWASFIKFWPYNFTLSLQAYQFDQMDGNGWLGLQNSLVISLATAVFGTLFIFTGAWILEKYPAYLPSEKLGKKVLRGLVLLPMGIPGIVLGLGYVFFFNAPSNPLSTFYGTLTLMVFCSVVHFYSSAHLTAATALRTLDPEFESASATLNATYLSTFMRVSMAMSLPVALDIARYLFVSTMTTVSALVFIYSPHTVVAAVSILNMDDAGFISSAAALSTLIMLLSGLVNILLTLASRTLLRKTQAWRTHQS